MDCDKRETRYKLAEGVYYRLAGDNVYVRNVTTRYDYLFNPMVKDILDTLKEERTKNELLVELEKTYDIEHANGFSDKLDRFLKSMVDKGVIDAKRPQAEPTIISDAEGIAKGFYQKNRKLWNTCFELTYLCNERCRHCYLDDPKANQETGILRFDVWQRVIDEIADMGCMNVLVTGGEPTLHPDFLQICSHITKRGMLLDIFSNGLMISQESLKDIIALHPNTVSVSLYGGDAEFHDYVTCVPGSFDKTFRTILMMKCAGVDVYVKSVLFKGRFDQYKKLKSLMDPIKIPIFCGQKVEAGRSGRSAENFDADNETLLDFCREQIATDPIWNEDEIPTRPPDSQICGVGVSTLTFRPNGDISPCIPYPLVLGNICRQDVKDVWANSSELEALRKMRFGDISERCKTCPDSGFCHVCPGVAYAESKKLAPCSYSCRHARVKHDLFRSLKAEVSLVS